MLIAGRRTGPTLLPMLLLLAVVVGGACGNRPLPLSSAVAGKGGLAGGAGSVPGHAGGGTGGSLAGVGGELVAGAGEGGTDATGGTVGTAGGAAGLATGGSSRLPDGGTSNGGIGVSDCTGRTKGTVCGAGTCADGIDGSVIRGRYACDGRGNCNPSEDVVCAPFACDVKTGGCLAACASDADCTNGKPCLNGSCGPKPLGATCLASAECQSGTCADGVCCNTTCATSCVSCAIPTHVGTCWPTAAGDPDPRGTCAMTNPASCGRNGDLRRRRRLRQLSGRDPVRRRRLPRGERRNVREHGQVQRRRDLRARHDELRAVRLRGRAGRVSHHLQHRQRLRGGRACVNGSCGLKEHACTTDAECLSGFCAQGLCCQSRATAPARAVRSPGQYGICTAGPGSRWGPAVHDQPLSNLTRREFHDPGNPLGPR